MRFLSITMLGTMFALAGLGACSSTTPFNGGAVDVSITADPALAASITTLSVEMSGAETLDLTAPPPSGFTTSGRADATIRASGTSGAVMVTVSGRNLAGDVVARGTADTMLQKGVAKVSVTLAAVAPATDMAVPMDLAMADLAPYPAIVPSNVSPTRYLPNAPAVSGLLTIDTSLLTFTRVAGTTNDGGFVESADAGSVMPAGVEFVADGNYAVLSTGALTIDRELWVTGSRPLVIVASGPVVIRNLIHAEARGTLPGPGGSTSQTGAGAGGSGVLVNGNIGTGGGGAGFGGAGAAGAGICSAGTPQLTCTTPAPAPGTAGTTTEGGGGVGGPVYAATALIGGSGGGNGGNTATCGPGGGGGGAIQISTSQTIDVLSPGAINVGGGGGSLPNFPTCNRGGGGGGSGGMILLEARGITVRGGQLSSSGGGGGIFQNNGGDGTLLLGGRGFLYSAFPQVVSGFGGIPSAPPTPGTDTTTGYSPGGSGGGGGWGVIRFRLPNGVDPSVSSPSTIVPTAVIDHSL